MKDAVQGYLDVIKAKNGQLNAVTVTNEKAMEEAEKLDVSHSRSRIQEYLSRTEKGS